MTTPLSSAPGVNVMLCGTTGTGKTHSIRTLVEQGLEVFVLFTEPGMEVLADLPPEKLHWHYVAPSAPDFSDMIASAQKINTMSFEALTKLPDINKRNYTEFIDVLTSLSNFKCDRTGESYG
jgi:Cdc6-like AAA superfamily ATPase